MYDHWYRFRHDYGGSGFQKLAINNLSNKFVMTFLINLFISHQFKYEASLQF